MDEVRVRIYLEEGFEPRYAKPGDAGMDVCAKDSMVVQPGWSAVIHTGIYMELPEGVECQVRPRSGLALNHSVTVLNSPGTIDSSYRGECNVILINHGQMPFPVERGDRIAQFVFARHCTASLDGVARQEDLAPSERGEGGFGHTGV